METAITNRIPVYGIALELIGILAGMVMITSCVTNKLPTEVKSERRYHVAFHYPNVINELDLIKIGGNSTKSSRHARHN